MCLLLPDVPMHMLAEVFSYGRCLLRLGLLAQIMFMAYGREVSPDTADLAAELLGFNPEQVLPMLSQPVAG